MSKRSLIDRIKYPQQYSIHIDAGNDALNQRLIEYLHSKAKYEARYRKSRFSKRLFNNKNS
ncbi:MAG: hypothetical protein ABIJ14_00595 [Nanoarchaeota archaeon]